MRKPRAKLIVKKQKREAHNILSANSFDLAQAKQHPIWLFFMRSTQFLYENTVLMLHNQTPKRYQNTLWKGGIPCCSNEGQSHMQGGQSFKGFGGTDSRAKCQKRKTATSSNTKMHTLTAGAPPELLDACMWGIRQRPSNLQIPKAAPQAPSFGFSLLQLNLWIMPTLLERFLWSRICRRKTSKDAGYGGPSLSCRRKLCKEAWRFRLWRSWGVEKFSRSWVWCR